MDIQADKIVQKTAETFRRTRDNKFVDPFLEQVYQSIIPVNKLLK